MKTEKTIYTCDRCGKEIDGRIIERQRTWFKQRIFSATATEIARYASLSESDLAEKMLLPEGGCVVLEGVGGYYDRKCKKIHFCRKCSKQFEIFMREGDKTCSCTKEEDKTEDDLK